jgi:diguanylate cyclase (GGDEF)-like protein
LIVNPNLEKKDGYELCAELRNNKKFKNVPIIILADQSFNEERFGALNLSLSEIITKPFSPKTLLSKVNSIAMKAKLVKKINPLTELPGKQHLEEELNQRIKLDQQFDLIFCDLKNFRTYNKVYGFEQGNKVIKCIADILQEELVNFGMAEAQLYHFGGDDFCVLLKPGYAEDLSKTIIERFDLEIPQLYYETDRNRGGLVITNRRGMVEQWPIMTIAMVLVSNSYRKINNWLEAEMIASEMLKFVKSMPGSQFNKDRRSS